MNIIVNGADGKMGRVLCALIKSGREHRALALVDKAFETDTEQGVFKSIFECTEKADVIIDFSFHTAVPVLCSYAVKTKTPLVIATTGHTEREKSVICSCARHIPVFCSANMSLGVALTACIAKMTAKAFPEAEIDIVETHHDKKADFPSGTALMLAEAVKAVRPQLAIRTGNTYSKARDKNELFIHSLRLGNAAGSHEIIFALPSQTVTIRHEAHDRVLFAEGALRAAGFILKKENGLYSAQDILE